MKSFTAALALASQALAIELASQAELASQSQAELEIQSQAELESQSQAELESQGYNNKYTITFTKADQR